MRGNCHTGNITVIEEKGDYGAVIVSGANLRIDETKLTITDDTGILLIQNELPDSVNLIASNQAKERGADVWLNAAPAKKIPWELLKNLDVLILNRVEAEYYRDILNLPELNHITKILTLGERGVEIRYPNSLIQHFPANLVEVQSTHGAGDMFIGALAASRLSSQNFEQAINYAQGAAALSVSKKGTETNFIEQPFASKTENLNPFLVFNWIGDIELDPPVDEWKETRRAPELTIFTGLGTFDNMLRERGLANTSQEIPVGTEWNEWQDQWSGNPRTSQTWRGNTLVQTTSRDVVQTRAGIRTTIVPQTLRQSLGNRVMSVAFIPFIRSRTVSFTARGMRPNTRVFPFFDNIDISIYVTPDGGSAGGNIVTDSNGSVTGSFAIPDPNVDSNPRWRTGKRVFRLTASSTNSQDRSSVATSAEADYDAKGLLETTQEAIIATREATTQRNTVTTSRTITRNASRTIAVRQPEPRGGGGDAGPDPPTLDKLQNCYHDRIIAPGVRARAGRFTLDH